MDRKDVAIIGLSAALIIAIVIAVILTSSVTVPGKGKVKSVNVGVFAHPNGTAPVTQIDWGTIPVGKYSQTYVYLMNTGNSPINLTLTTGNWTPTTCPSYLTLTWNLTSAETLNVPAGYIQPCLLTLTVASNTTGISDFTMDITFTGTG